MNKVRKGPQTWLYPLPALLIGTTVDGKPNVMTASWAGMACTEPPMVFLGMLPHRHTFSGMIETGEFSVNVPSASMTPQVDLCGIASGAVTDKIARCGFTLFYGTLTHAPLINQCPLNLECTVEFTREMGSHTLMLGRIVETYVTADCLDADGMPDFRKIDPISYVHTPAKKYTRLGDVVADSFSAGHSL
ncbi:MAG: flavin reductase family protein [Dehalococcoidia bacterium]|nr:flavin reductase family protein [Dehalococcoidia bacterium]